ncbi:FimV/HubP family polar landmark protein [Rhodanobacter umsongensis]|uniref:FimV/HubP family polar landmark protein n=1 Tax=Rhodanobacter umsongensis TaxID=633153 RepID=A0ABW0JPN6_9GAMM
MNRSLKLSMLMALALGTSQAIALDLGQIQVKSALGQPLLAEIPVHPANPAELQNLTVRLASSEEFARAGIVGGRTVIPLHFSVANAAGGRVIRITSSEPVDDPYLDLLLEVNSNAGRSVREFAILLDPASAAAVAAAPAQRPAAPVRPAPSQPATPRVAAAPRAAPISNGQYGPVARGQTLSSIARSAAPAGVDARQMMLALKQANPDAFYRDNINALKSGAILRVPTSAEAQAMTIAAAMAEVRRQNSDWRAGTPGTPAVVADTATRASASSAPSGTASGAGDRLALVQAKDSKNAGGPGSSAASKDDKAAAGLRQDLLRNQESLASLQQQSTELKTRLKDMADINSKNEHLLSLKDSEIADLQAKLAAARKSAGLPAVTPAAAPAPSSAASAQKPAAAETRMETATASTVAMANPTPAGATSSVVATTTPAAASSIASAASTSAPGAAAVAPARAKPVAKPVTGAAAAAADEQPWYMQTWAWGAGAAAIALLVLLALLGRRRKPAAGSSKSASSLADRFGSAPSAGKDLIDGEDVDQEELLDQLAEHPDDIGLHLELVTLYYSRRDVEHFEAAAEAMHAHITDPQQDEWQDVMHMGEDLVPGHPLFDHHAEPPVHDEAEAHREFDIDDYADERDAPTAVSAMPPLPPGAPKKVSEYNFNFDLTKPTGAEPPHLPPAADDATVVAPLAAAAEAKAPPATETSWHFDDAESMHPADGHDVEEFNDDPIDTKLDLARAYLDMGDADGARAMLGEVMKEGSQMQRDTAKRLLDNLH